MANCWSSFFKGVSGCKNLDKTLMKNLNMFSYLLVLETLRLLCFFSLEDHELDISAKKICSACYFIDVID